MDSLVESIYGVLKRRRYNREKPYKEEELRQRLNSFIVANKPISLVGFWGVGPKQKTNWADEESCEFLASLNEQIATIYSPAIDFEFVFAEPHGIHNGVPKETIGSYVSDVTKLFDKYGFQYTHLAPLWTKYGISFEEIELLLRQKPDGWWSQIPNHDEILANARQRNHRLPTLVPPIVSYHVAPSVRTLPELAPV